MKSHPLAKSYDFLTPEERWRLILAASGRGDVAERDRLVLAGKSITLSMQDHAPYAHAFDELATLFFIELLEEAVRYQDSFHFSDSEEEEEGEGIPQEELEEGLAREYEGLEGKRSMAWYGDLILASGYMLRAKAEGWKLFCERMNIPAFLHWQDLPGFDRLQRALSLAEKAAFTPEGFRRWLNRIRPKGVPELTELPVSDEIVAKANEAFFRERVRWWSG
jgi:hypothetical protein